MKMPRPPGGMRAGRWGARVVKSAGGAMTPVFLAPLRFRLCACIGRKARPWATGEISRHHTHLPGDRDFERKRLISCCDALIMCGLMSREIIRLLPFVREERGGVFGRERGTSDFSGVCKDSIKVIRNVVDCRQYQFVGRDADMLEAVAVGHNEVCHSEGDAGGIASGSEAVPLRFHHHAKRA